jgi:GntR family transcriptional repressor for pyruvate dehydrogenase complex
MAPSADREPAGGIDWSRLARRPAHVPDDLSANLEQMIVDGELGRGDRLPAERELATSLRVSRASVREALRDLELKGLIDRRPGRGTIVSGDPQRTRQGGSLLGRLSSSERDLLEVMDLRATIEPPIAARAASRATPAGLRGLREIVEAMEGAATLEETVELDERFHREISRATHNPLLVRLLEVTTEWMGPSRKSTLQSEDRRAASIAAHRRILEAIGAHDPVDAEEAMAAHIESVNELLAARLPRSVRPPRARRARG